MIPISDTLLSRTTELRHRLHTCPESSGNEVRTAMLLKQFLSEYTSLELRDCGAGFYAAHREPDTAVPGIALRADYDALDLGNGTAAHLCGHDGHAAALCGVALLLEGQRIGRNVFLLFQPAEETGQGAQSCREIFDRESINEIYGIHNLPGYPLGKVFVREGTFACASRGMAVTLKGICAHAAYPETGISPAKSLGELLCQMTELNQDAVKKHALCTVIGARLGEQAFGTAPGYAELWLTLRAEQDAVLEEVSAKVREFSERAAADDGLSSSISIYDPFPATVNDPACAEKVRSACNGTILPEPMRWSEDFGHYLNRCRGAFLGIGAGENQPPLHNPCYDYPDALLLPTIRTFWALLEAPASAATD